MVNLVIGVSRVRANSTNIAQAINDMRKEFKGGNKAIYYYFLKKHKTRPRQKGKKERQRKDKERR